MMQNMVHNLGVVSLMYLTGAAVLLAELAIAAQIDKRSVRKRGRAVARPQQGGVL